MILQQEETCSALLCIICGKIDFIQVKDEHCFFFVFF